MFFFFNIILKYIITFYFFLIQFNPMLHSLQYVIHCPALMIRYIPSKWIRRQLEKYRINETSLYVLWFIKCIKCAYYGDNYLRKNVRNCH